MRRSTSRAHRRGGFTACVLLALALLVAGAAPAAAQYGGVSGLFVTISPANPNVADFTGLGCAGGDEVVLYMPTVTPTSADPASTQTVPGRVLAVTTALSSDNDLDDGAFSFPNIVLPPELEPGIYAVHARCGPLDLRVLVEIAADGAISVEPDADPNSDTTTQNGIPEALPFTGRDSNRLVSLGAALVLAGAALGALAHRSTRRSLN